MKPLAPLALLALALLAPVAQAQADPTGISLTAASAGEVPFQGDGSFAVEVTVGCALLLQQAANNFEVVIAAPTPPAWLSLEDVTVSFADPATVQSCVTSMGAATSTVQVPFSVAADAPGVEQLSVELVATAGSTASEPATAPYKVAYNSNYTVATTTTFPLTMTTPEVKFQVVATQASNARSMIMIEGVSVSAGSFAGLPSTVYEVAAGAPASKTFDVTFKAPEGAWERATVSFDAFGHYLLVNGEAGDYSPAQKYTFEFVNGGIPTAPKGDGEGKESPAPVAALTALGLLGLVAVLRRKA